MALTGKYTTVHEIIERVCRKTDYDLYIDIGDVIEWTWDVINAIGVPNAYIDRVTDGEDLPVLEVINYQVALPYDLHTIYLARDLDSGLPMVCKNSPYKGDETVPLSIYESALSYSTNNEYMFTSFEEGSVELAFKAFPTDNLGLPLIPDDARYIKAVTAYITEQISSKLWRKGLISDKVYTKDETESLFYLASARSKALIPTLAEIEGIKNRWLRLRQNPNLFDYSFKYMADKQRLILHNNLGT